MEEHLQWLHLTCLKMGGPLRRRGAKAASALSSMAFRLLRFCVCAEKTLGSPAFQSEDPNSRGGPSSELFLFIHGGQPEKPHALVQMWFKGWSSHEAKEKKDEERADSKDASSLSITVVGSRLSLL